MPTEEEGLRHLLERYLGGFGPAALADVAGWAGVPPARLRPIVATADLRRFNDEMGRQLIDLQGAPIPAEDTSGSRAFSAAIRRNAPGQLSTDPDPAG